MIDRNEIPKEISNFLEYDGTSSTGLRWKKARLNINVGDEAGSLHHNGYYITGFNGKLYLNHRIIYFLMHGYCPDILDHIDNKRSNNNINNLREASLEENRHNSGIPKTNTSGHKNITNLPNDGKYGRFRVVIMVNGKRHSKSLNKKDFTIDDAIKIRDKMIAELCGDFGNNGT